MCWNRIQQLLIRIIVIILPFSVGIFRNRLIVLAQSVKKQLPECKFHIMTGCYCPACGNTRSVMALMQGDILLSIRNNAIIPFLLLIAIAFYAELILFVFGVRIQIVPRSNIFLAICVGSFLIYFLLRNFIPIIAPV